MNDRTNAGKGSLQGLLLSQLLALLFLAGCVSWVYRELELVLGATPVTASIAWNPGRDTVLTVRLAGFAIAALLAHIALGLTALGLSRLTMAALPDRSAGREISLTLAWALLLMLLVLGANATWYPASRFAGGDSWLLSEWHGLTPVLAMLTAIGTMIIALAILALRRAAPRRPTLRRGLVVAALLALAGGLQPPLGEAFSHPAAMYTQPHVVILGVDSLRDDLADVSEGRQLAPNIDAFLAGAHRFRDAVSPLARTYPAWVAILTGRDPVTTNARFNLMPRSLVHEGDTLADALHAHGYRSVFATDEVRFANFDESFGFDQLITPPIGASDFVLGEFGDLPLVNLLTATRIGGWLFPSNRANRAAAVTYEPAHFVARLDREIDVTGPSFIAIHLTLSHWPYSWAGQALPTTPQQFRPSYRRAIEEVDRQFAEVLGVLNHKGVLNNAIVVVLSDHGEALGFQSDSMLRKTGTDREIWNSIWGHGTSVMSPHQYGVLLAMRAFGRARLPVGPAANDWPVSLADVRPTLEEFVTGAAPRNVDGISLLPFLAGTGPMAALESRLRFTETDFSTRKLMTGKINPSGLVREGAAYYEMVPETGWVQLRPSRLHEIMLKKQRAVLSRSSLLAAIPSWTDDSVSFLFTDRRSPLPRPLKGRPDPATDPEAARLWDALHARFMGELPVDSELPQM
jgi:hypothetical protein